MKDKMIVKNFYEKIVSENRLEELPKYVSENCVLNLGDKIVPLGLDGMKQHLVAVKRTYPDYTMEIVRQFSDKEYVISEFIMTGTHEGEWMGMKPTHKKLSFSGINIDRVVNGKIMEHGGSVNTFETLLEANLIKSV